MVSEQMQNIDVSIRCWWLNCSHDPVQSEVWGSAMDTLASSLAEDVGQMMAGHI